MQLQLLLFLLPSALSSGPISQSRPDTASPDSSPTITRFEVTSRIQLRFASTQVLSHVTNPSQEAQEVKFEIRLPEKAFISHFSMLVNGTERNATVQGKETAKQTYDDAKEVGIGAGLVSRETEDSSLFSVATNVPANEEAVFTLHYYELLKRDKGWYEHTVNLQQDIVVPTLKVEVFIEESLPLTEVEVPKRIRETSSIPRNLREELEQVGEYTSWEEGMSHILYQPNTAQQEEARLQKVSGQFAVRYKVEMNLEHGEVQVIDGYFVHFTEDDPKLDSLPKYTVFVLDVSGSMRGEKIIQLRDAMFAIINEMSSQDYFSIITFNSYVKVWSSAEAESTTSSSQEPLDVMEASRHNRDLAITFTISLQADGGTNINEAMLRGLAMSKEKMETPGLLPDNVKSMVVFLTDGQATSGVTYKSVIKSNIREANSLKLPLYCLAFGSDADFKLMKEISQEADSWAKMIYEGGDAAIQLENFYSQIASPVISNLKFEYTGILEEDRDLVSDDIATVFKGSSYCNIGRIDDSAEVVGISLIGEETTGRKEERFNVCLRQRRSSTMRSLSEITVDVMPTRFGNCFPPSVRPPVRPRRTRSQAQNFLQKLHAYVHIRKLIHRDNKAEVEGGESDKERALRLALDNGFVTEITSLVVTDSQDDVILATVGDIEGAEQVYPGRRGSSVMHSPVSTSRATAMSSPTVMNSPISTGWYNRGRGRGSSRGSSRRRGSISRSGSRHRPPVLSDVGPQILTTTTDSTPIVCDGNITLYSNTYLRGENVTIDRDIDNLESIDFDNKLVSVSMSGSVCCWNAFTDPFYTGETKQFLPGVEYKSVSSVGSMFRAASSVRQTPC